MIGQKMPGTCFGLKVFVQEDQPRLQLGEPVKQYLTPEQIADHNAWMLRFFGTTNILADGQYIVSEAYRFVTMNPRTYSQFRRQTFDASGVSVPDGEGKKP